MAKKIVEDVLPPSNRSIRNIPIPGGKSEKKEKPIKSERQPEKPTKKEVPKQPRRVERELREARESREPKRNYNRKSIWIVAILCVIGLVFALSFVFAGATVTVTAKQETISVDETISAEKDSSAKGLSYTLISVSKEGSKTVPASGEERVEKRATGKVIIYNNYSASPQVLVKNTRFETPDGLIFRIQDSVTVPGYTKSNSIILPGLIKVNVFADQPGEKYNIGLADFTIPGFKGDPRYTKFNAKSDPTVKIEGGFSGTIRKVSEADKASAKEEIETILKEELMVLAKTQIPNTHVLYDSMTMFSFEPLAQRDDGPGTATINEKGTIHGVLFDKKELTDFLINQTTSEQAVNPSISATNLDALEVVFNNKNSFNPNTPVPVSARISGSLNIVWDAMAKNAENRSLEEELAGRKRSEIKGILSKFSSIERAEVVVRPFWSLSFPEKPSKIKVRLH